MEIEQELRGITLRLAEMFNLSEGEIGYIRQHNIKNLREILDGLIKQLTMEDLAQFTSEEMVILRKYGFRTEEEEMLREELHDITFEGCVVYYMMLMAETPFRCFELAMNGKELYEELSQKHIEVEEAVKITQSILDRFSHANTSYLFENNGEYELNPLARIGEIK